MRRHQRARGLEVQAAIELDAVDLIPPRRPAARQARSRRPDWCGPTAPCTAPVPHGMTSPPSRVASSVRWRRRRYRASASAVVVVSPARDATPGPRDHRDLVDDNGGVLDKDAIGIIGQWLERFHAGSEAPEHVAVDMVLGLRRDRRRWPTRPTCVSTQSASRGLTSRTSATTDLTGGVTIARSAPRGSGEPGEVEHRRRWAWPAASERPARLLPFPRPLRELVGPGVGLGARG